MNTSSYFAVPEGWATIAPSNLERFCAAVLGTLGVPDEVAALVADSLVAADLRGVGSHGVIRMAKYAERLEKGAVNPAPRVRTVRESRNTAVIDGDNGMGQWVAAQAMAAALTKAANGEPTFVAVRNSNHFGAAAYFAEMALAHDQIGIALTVGGVNHMLPWGAAEPLLGNNPIAIAMPGGAGRAGGGDGPVVLDMACSVAARGKIMAAVAAGTEIPGDWATDSQGRPTTDPNAAMHGFLQPIAGPKGYALTLTIGLLGSMLSGAAFGTEMTDWFSDFDRPQNIGHLLGVLPVATFEDPERYRARMAKAAHEMHSARRAPGVDRIYLPGERERLLMAERRETGIPLSPGVHKDLVTLGARHGIELDLSPPAA